jgi:hypothetical protein
MKNSVKIVVKKENRGIVKEYQTLFETNESMTSLELKNTIKESINFPFESLKDVLYDGSKELKDSNLLKKVDHLEYQLFIK